MQFTDFEKCIELSKTFSSMLKWDMQYVRTRFVDNGTILIEYKSSEMRITENQTMANKILTVHCKNKSTGTWMQLMQYKKRPEDDLSKYCKQRPAKDRIFNLSLETALPLTYEDMEKMEELMDELQFKIKFDIMVY